AGRAAAERAAEPKIKVHQLKNADSQEMARIVASLFDGLRVAPDRRTNSIVIIGPGDDMMTIEAILQQLDASPSRPEKQDRPTSFMRPAAAKDPALADMRPGSVRIQKLDGSGVFIIQGQ